MKTVSLFLLTFLKTIAYNTTSLHKCKMYIWHIWYILFVSQKSLLKAVYSLNILLIIVSFFINFSENKPCCRVCRKYLKRHSHCKVKAIRSEIIRNNLRIKTVCVVYPDYACKSYLTDYCKDLNGQYYKNLSVITVNYFKSKMFCQRAWNEISAQSYYCVFYPHVF